MANQVSSCLLKVSMEAELYGCPRVVGSGSDRARERDHSVDLEMSGRNL